MNEEPRTIQAASLPISGVNFSLRGARNILWCPAYHAWTQSGGFDYRSHVRDILLSRLVKMVNEDGMIDSDANLLMPCMSQIDFPSSMKNVHSLLTKNLASFIKETRRHGTRLHASQYNAIEGCITMRNGLNFELLLSRGDVTTLMYIDPFPPGNPWAASREELEFLSLLLSPLRGLIAEHAPDGVTVTIAAGVLNASTMHFQPAVENDQRLGAIFQTMDVVSKIAPPIDDIRKKIMKELDYGPHRR